MIAVVADDFSGAAEVAGWAVAAGYTAELCRDFAVDPRVENRVGDVGASDIGARDVGARDVGAGDVGATNINVADADVVVLDTDSRGAPVAEAAARAGAVAAWLRALGVARVFQKIDSVLRGHVAAESHALRVGLGRRRSLVVPANPRRHRVVREGRYAIAGEPLHETHFAHDSDFPAWTDRVVELIERPAPRHHEPFRGGRLTLATPKIVSCAADMAEWPAAELIVGDASSSEELEAWTKRLDGDTLPVGAAEFFASWLSSCPRAKRSLRTLLVCGSPAAWFQGRASDARARGLTVLRWGNAELNHFAAKGDAGEDTLLSMAQETLAVRDRLLVTCHEDDEYASATASTEELLRSLGRFARRILAPLLAATHPRDGRPLVERLLVEGGATTAALVKELEWTRFEALAPVADGITPLVPLVPRGGDAADGGNGTRRFTLFSKPGSYAWPADLW
ncbi:MAG: four-carbon acid sugar kinase family protein [Planctomycetota bacterium]